MGVMCFAAFVINSLSGVKRENNMCHKEIIWNRFEHKGQNKH